MGEFAATLPRVDIEQARHPGALDESELVKDNTVRTVARLADPDNPDGPGLYVKRYKFRDLRDRLRHLAVPTKPVVEWRICRALQAAGIPTCNVLAIAVRREGGMPREGFLISREIPDAVTLRQFLQQGGSRRAIEVVEELADLTARLANNRFHHRDYHVGNLLVRPDAQPGRRLFVVDLHSIRKGHPTRRRMLRMLGMLALSAGEAGLSREDLTGFLRALLRRWRGGPGASEASVARWAEWVETACRKLRRRRMRSRTRRCVRESSLFTAERAAGYRIHHRRDFPVRAALGALESHAGAIGGDTAGGEVFHKGQRTEVTVCACDSVPPFGVPRPAHPDQVKPGRACVKAFRRDSWGERLKDLLRWRGRARAAWIAAQGFSVRGIPAARPLALLESRSKLSGRPDYLITEALETDGNLWEFVRQRLPQGARRRLLGKAIAGLLCRMADEEVYHPDTKPRNFLIKETDEGFRLWLVDLDRVRFDVRLDRMRWVKYLARVNAGLPAEVSALDRMRCLRECSRGRWGARDRLAIARRAYELSLRRRPAWLEPGQR